MKKSQPGPFGASVGGMTREQIQQFFLQQMQLFGPALSALAHSAVLQGARMEQGLGSQLGRAGLGGSTGIGAMLRGVGGTYAAQAVQTERLKAIMGAMTNAVQLGQGVGNQFVQMRGSEIQGGQGQSWDQRILGAIGSLVGAGADIYGAAKMPKLGGGNLGEPGLEPQNPTSNMG